MGDPAFWNDADAAREIIAEANSLKAWTDPWNRLAGKVNDLEELRIPSVAIHGVIPDVSIEIPEDASPAEVVDLALEG